MSPISPLVTHLQQHLHKYYGAHTKSLFAHYALAQMYTHGQKAKLLATVKDGHANPTKLGCLALSQMLKAVLANPLGEGQPPAAVPHLHAIYTHTQTKKAK